MLSEQTPKTVNNKREKNEEKNEQCDQWIKSWLEWRNL